MVKKLVSLAGAGAILLSLAVPAFAVVYTSHDVAIIKGNDVTAVANTGMNSQSNVADVKHGGGVSVSGGGSRYINTGDAHAKAGTITVANTHVSCCVGSNSDDLAVIKWNDVEAYADSGMNAQDNYAKVRHGGGVSVSGGDGRTLYTGNAWAKAGAITVVNTHWH